MPSLPPEPLPVLSDSDDGWLGIISRIDPAQVPKGFGSDAINRRFDDKVVRNRWGVVRPVWGGTWTTASGTLTVVAASTTHTIYAGTIPTGCQIAVDPTSYTVIAVTVTNSGSGYTTDPTVTITPNGSGAATSAVCSVTRSGNTVASISVTSGGQGYSSSAPSVAITGGGGSGATATCTVARYYGFQGGVTRVVSGGTNTNCVTSETSFNYSGNRTATYYSSTDSLGEIVGSCTYVDQRTGVEVVLVAVNEARTSDGGQGNVYVLAPGQSSRTALGYSTGLAPLAMNHFDFYQTVRMIPAANGVIMLRQGAERFYFKGDAVSSNTITTQVAHDLETGQKIKFGVVSGSSPLTGLKSGVVYYVNAASTTTIKLFTTKTGAIAGSSPVSITATSSSNRYYLEVAENKEFYTPPTSSSLKVSSVVEDGVNDSRPLIMQTGPANQNALDYGFFAVSTYHSITSSQEDTQTSSYWSITSANHGLVPGDSIVVTVTSGLTGVTSGSTYYVFPIDANSLRFYSTELAALAGLPGSSGSQLNITATGTGSWKKTGASGAPIPNGREGIYFKDRLLLVYGRDNLAVSDILDPLLYSPLISDYRLNTGTNDKVTSIYPFNDTTLVVFKEKSILSIENIYGDLSNIRLVELTREYGCVAPLSIASSGSDLVFLSTKGVATIKQTEFGLSQNLVIPLSDPIQDKIERIDSVNVSKACGCYWRNKFLISVPEEDGNGTNQMTLVFNFLNQAWEGEWNGDYFIPKQWFRLSVSGTPRMCWIDESGFVHYFDEGALNDRLNTSTEVSISTSFKTRGYELGLKQFKKWSTLTTNLSSWNPNYSIYLLSDGVQETLSLKEDETKSRVDYYTYGTTDWNPTNANDDFLIEKREDYSLLPGFMCESNGVKVNLHQTFTDKSRLLGNSNAAQMLVTTSQGSLIINNCQITGSPWSQYGSLNV